MAKKPAPKAAKPKAPAPKPSESTALTSLAGAGELIVAGDKVPAHLQQQGAARGNENVGTEDLMVPRLGIVQAISPEVEPANPLYIKGAKAGDMFNSATRQLYGTRVMVVPVHFQKMYLVWKDRKQGGGFFGAFPDQMTAQDKAEAEGGKKSGIEVLDTPTHLCLLVDTERMAVDEIMIPMPRTKAKISRQWNSMIRMTGMDRFARAYSLSTQQQKNNKGTFYNFAVAQSGYPAAVLHAAAEKMFKSIQSGRTFNMDTRNMDAGGEPAADPSADPSADPEDDKGM
jgi:hypothetical protein